MFMDSRFVILFFSSSKKNLTDDNNLHINVDFINPRGLRSGGKKTCKLCLKYDCKIQIYSFAGVCLLGLCNMIE